MENLKEDLRSLKMNKKILIVAAQPDDEVLGCFGTVARLIQEGYEAYTLILGEGKTSRDEKRVVENKKDELDILNSENDSNCDLEDHMISWEWCESDSKKYIRNFLILETDNWSLIRYNNLDFYIWNTLLNINKEKISILHYWK